jgi:phosphopentomutase
MIVFSSEDNLQQLHEIHESIQQMRDQTTVQALNSQVSAGTEIFTNLASQHDSTTSMNFTLSFSTSFHLSVLLKVMSKWVCYLT